MTINKARHARVSIYVKIISAHMNYIYYSRWSSPGDTDRCYIPTTETTAFSQQHLLRINSAKKSSLDESKDELSNLVI